MRLRHATYMQAAKSRSPAKIRFVAIFEICMFLGRNKKYKLIF